MQQRPSKRWDQVVKEIENTPDYQCKVIFAAEIGSRAWGLSNADSDYDVGMIYVRPLKEYFRVNSGHRDQGLQNNRSTIERKIGDLIEVKGYDIGQILQFAYESNPTLANWLRLPEPYFEHPLMETVRELYRLGYSQLRLRQKSFSTMQRNWKAYVDGKTHVPTKKYVHTVQAFLDVLWYDTRRLDPAKHATPPHRFDDLVNVASGDFDLFTELLDLRDRKLEGRVMVGRYPNIDHAIVYLLSQQRIPEHLVRLAPAIEPYDAAFSTIVTSPYLQF